MKRFVKANDSWWDTLMEQKQWGRYFFVIDGFLWYYDDESGKDYNVGVIQDERDE